MIIEFVHTVDNSLEGETVTHENLLWNATKNNESSNDPFRDDFEEIGRVATVRLSKKII
jgi:hypothetical protein